MHDKTNLWGKFLVWAEWCYNTSVHSAIGISPFEVTFGWKLPSIPQYLSGTSNVLAVDDVLSDREAMFISLRKKLLKSQERVKATVDAHQRDVNFEPGE